ncbi:MAG: 50S ribosomal protein L11 methyltransferase [Deltaproteobacteria bacterium]|nr:50S ribosomal protein L11 methyltransferase [Deltaproteobacteria bacterium]MBW2665638.1 50S ribosomal protein L11 methyltransferase [Deltaproteobacteria bacterium]
MLNSDNDNMATSATGFARIRVCAAETGAAEWISAEAWAAGAAGVEERDSGGRIELLIYAPAAEITAVRDAVSQTGVALDLEPPETVLETDWAEQWKQGLEAIVVSARLVVRPSFVAHALEPGQLELVIDPGQAFGTGGHASTRLSLEWIDALAEDLPTAPRVLDVGTGTGVLALAAIRLAGAHAVAFDLDPLAAEAVRENAETNGVREGLSLFIGPLDALAPIGFDLVLANLLKSELLPLLGGIAERVRPGGYAVFAGLLASEADEIRAAPAARVFTPVAVRETDDANGDRWIALLMRR